MKALLIEFDGATGRRAGNINPKDPKLQCYGWQDLDSVPAREIRLVEDDRDLSQYEGIPGVTILIGAEQINQVIDSVVKPRYSLESEALFLEDIRQRGIKLSDFSGKSRDEILKTLSKQGVISIREIIPRKV